MNYNYFYKMADAVLGNIPGSQVDTLGGMPSPQPFINGLNGNDVLSMNGLTPANPVVQVSGIGAVSLPPASTQVPTTGSEFDLSVPQTPTPEAVTGGPISAQTPEAVTSRPIPTQIPGPSRLASANPFAIQSPDYAGYLREQAQQVQPQQNWDPTNVPVPQTPEALRDLWVKQKEQYYRGRADKYPQYQNYTVSQANQDALLLKAQQLFNDPNADVKKYLGMNGASDYSSARYQREQQEAAKQQKQKQNRVARAAIENQPEYGSSFEDIQRFSDSYIQKHGYNPDSLSDWARDYRKAISDYASRVYPYRSGMTPFAQFAEEASKRKASIYGGAQDFVTGVTNHYLDNKFGDQYGPLTPGDQKWVDYNRNRTWNDVDPTGTVAYDSKSTYHPRAQQASAQETAPKPTQGAQVASSGAKPATSNTPSKPVTNTQK